jgi:hypothetical protein
MYIFKFWHRIYFPPKEITLVPNASYAPPMFYCTLRYHPRKMRHVSVSMGEIIHSLSLGRWRGH